MRRHLTDCRAKFVFTDTEHLDVVRSAAEDSTDVRHIFVVCSGADVLPKDARVQPFHSLRTPPTALPKVELEPRMTTLVLPYSSGTTGVQKGVKLTHHAIFAAVAAVNVKEFPFPRSGQWTLCFLPFFHIYGLVSLLVEGLRRGAPLLIMPRFSPQLLLRLIQDYKIGTLIAVPPILVFLAKDPTVTRYDLSSLTWVTVGAAPAGKDLIREFKERFPHVRYVTQSYGMTECAGAAIVAPATHESQKRHGTCGLLCPSVEAKIVDPETGGEIRECGKPGEICMRGPTLMTGYLNRPRATAQTIDRDGWLHSGDIGYVDSKGYWYVVDRIKELIKVKGFQVAPAELEDLLLGCEGVADAAVIGVPDPKAGELPKAFIVKHQGARLSEADVQAFVRGRVAPYKELKGGVRFVDHLPKSPSGKILRRLLRAYDKAKL